MAVRYVTVDEVRAISGVDSTLVSNESLTTMIELAEYGVEKELNCSFSPKEEIEILTGQWTHLQNLKVSKTPLLAIRAIKSDTTTVTLSTVKFDDTGIIALGDTSEITTWDTKYQTVRIKYLHARMDTENEAKLTSGAMTKGTSVTVTLDDVTGLSVGNYVQIQGMDGNIEATKITAIDTILKTITVNEISFNHESGSDVKLLSTPSWARRLMLIVSAMAAVAQVVGASFDERTGYTVGSLSIQKGEPYTQWRETANQLSDERDRMMAKIMPTPFILA